MINMKRLNIVHPFLFAAFPVLFLYSHNVNQVKLTEIFLPLLIVICFSILLWLPFFLFTKDKEKAGIIVSIFILLFFSYGRVFDAISGWTVGELLIGRPKYILLIWVILFILGAYFIIKIKRNLHNLTGFLNIVAFCLVIFSIISGLYAYPWQENITAKNVQENEDGTTNNIIEPGKRPDIYYIILDAYARADVLKEIYQYDNTEFLNRLAQKGFFIADNSRANYSHTISSLASSLNFKYLDYLVSRHGEDTSGTFWPTMKMINNNRVFKFLKQRDYRIVFVSTTLFFDDGINSADIYISSPNWSLTQFQSELLNTTPIPITLIYLYEKTGKFGDFRADLQRDRILYAFDHLADMAKTKRDYPVFVFAHIIAPHAPFVFGKNGERINTNDKFSYRASSYNGKEEYRESYKNQLIFVTKMIVPTIDDILSNSDEPPIIILQSDHGPDVPGFDWQNPNNSNIKERFSILNAYYLPDKNYGNIYNHITPVNTFRVIFNQYFGTEYPLLKDETYFNPPKTFKFIKITDQLK